MLDGTVYQWLLSLPVWGIVGWFIVMGTLYTTGINLSRSKGRWWLGVSFIAVLMSYTYISSSVYGAGLEGEAFPSIVPVLVSAALIIGMVGWGSTSKSKLEGVEK